MPSATAQTAKLALRRALAEVTGGYKAYTTSGAGTTTSAVIAALSGIGQDYVLDMPWMVCVDGNNAREFSRATGLSSTTVSFATAYTNAVASGVAVEFYPFRPSLYTQAWNRAIQTLYAQHGIYRVMNAYRITQSDRLGHLSAVTDAWYSVPQGIDRVSRVTRAGLENVWDNFTRDNSTTDPGNGWAANSGDTFGITSNLLYSVSDADADTCVRSSNPLLQNVYLECQLSGTMTTTTAVRAPAVVFRYIESTNFLYVDIYNSLVRINKMDGGSSTALSTLAFTPSNGNYYRVSVAAVGTRIQVWVDDVLQLDYQLTGANAAKYTVPGNIGFYLTKTGAPGTAARWDGYACYELAGDYPWPDWRQSADKEFLEIPAFGQFHPTGLLRIEGAAQPTLLTSDNTSSLSSDDATTVLEISTTDEAYPKLLEQARSELFRLIGSDIRPDGIPAASAQYLSLAQDAALKAKSLKGMPALATTGRGPAFV